MTVANEPSTSSTAMTDLDEQALLELIGMIASPPEGALDWQDEAVCAQTDPEAFFPEKGGSTRDAKTVCSTCPVREQCLEYALENEERFGIWGGLSERERRKISKERREEEGLKP